MDETGINLYSTNLMACAAMLTRRWGGGVHTVGLEEGRKGNEKRAMEMSGGGRAVWMVI